MLGRLAKWLRMLGFDAVYVRDINDRELVRRARSEQRILLTRDTRLIQDFHLTKYLLIRSNDIHEQIREVHHRYNLRSGGRSRCVSCNGQLDEMSKEMAMDKVPDFVYLHCPSFSRCRSCGTIYWEGTHKTRFTREVEKLLVHGE